MQALLSGKYDLNKVVVIMSQTDGGCRKPELHGFIRRALEKADMTQILLVSINLSGLVKIRFKITPILRFVSLLCSRIRRYHDEMYLPDASL